MLYEACKDGPVVDLTDVVAIGVIEYHGPTACFEIVLSSGATIWVRIDHPVDHDPYGMAELEAVARCTRDKALIAWQQDAPAFWWRESGDY